MSGFLYVSEDRTVLVRQFEDGTTEVATREHPNAIWGPPITVTKEKTA